MRALQAAVIVMGVLIVAGVATIVVTVVSRLSGGGAGAAATQALLDEPAGTRIAGASVAADRVAVQLQGGGSDRVVVVDTRSGHVIARIGLAH
jgi:Family of unknown function (DUF6476)